MIAHRRVVKEAGWNKELVRMQLKAANCRFGKRSKMRVMWDPCAASYCSCPALTLPGCVQTGLSGDSGGGGATRADNPNFFAELYNPDAPLGARYSTLARSRIMRMYHSTAALTTNGTILVSGCDRCAKVSSNLDFDPPPVRTR